MDAGSELPADLAEAGEVTLGVAGLDAAESASRADAADGFSAVVTEQIAVGGSARTAVVPVNMVNVLQTDTVGMIGSHPASSAVCDWVCRTVWM